MKLITELNEDVKYLTEDNASTGGKNLYIHGVFLQSNIKNKNGRIYPEHIMDNEVNRYITEMVNTKKSLGELTHPEKPSLDPKMVSHLITELVKEGTNWVGKARILDTPMGGIVKGIIEGGGVVGVSSRALGSVKMNSMGINEVQSDFRICTAADIVLDPSGPQCFVQGIMESVDWSYDDRLGWKMQDLNEQTQKEIEKAVITKSLNEQNTLKMFNNYLNKLANLEI
jgi:Prohead core protein serine protease